MKTPATRSRGPAKANSFRQNPAPCGIATEPCTSGRLRRLLGSRQPVAVGGISADIFEILTTQTLYTQYPLNRSRRADLRNLPAAVRGIASTNSKASGSQNFGN